MTSPTVTDPPGQDAHPAAPEPQPGPAHLLLQAQARSSAGTPPKASGSVSTDARYALPSGGRGRPRLQPAKWAGIPGSPPSGRHPSPAPSPLQGRPLPPMPSAAEQVFSSQPAAQAAPPRPRSPTSPFPPQAGVPPEQLPPPRLEDRGTRASPPGPGPAESCDLPAMAGPRTRRERHLRWVLPPALSLPRVLSGGGLAGGGWSPGWLEEPVPGP